MNKIDIFDAIEKNDILKVKQIVEFDSSNISKKGILDVTPLHASSAYDNVIITKYLISKGANIEAKAKDGATPLMMCSKNLTICTISILLHSGALIDNVDDRGLNILSYAANKGNLDFVECLIKNKATINNLSNENETPLMFAVLGGHLDVVKLLIHSGAEYKTCKTHSHYIHVAASEGHLDIVKYFVKKGISIDLEDDEGYTVFDYAHAYGKKSVANYILDVKCFDALNGISKIIKLKKLKYATKFEPVLSKKLNST